MRRDHQIYNLVHYICLIYIYYFYQHLIIMVAIDSRNNYKFISLRRFKPNPNFKFR